jgi:hypothetical protein
VLDPARRVGREIGVLAEDVVGADVRLQLHQEALLAERARAVDSKAPSG